MKVFAFINARLREASTYAGVSALCLAVPSALGMSGTARYISLLGAVASGIGAMAKSDNNAGLASAMNQAVELVPVLTTAVKAAEGSLSPSSHRLS